MKRIFIFTAFALAVSSCLVSFLSALGDDAPRMYVNDRPYGKSGTYPVVLISGTTYVPADIFGEFSRIELTLGENGGFLIENTDSGTYISYPGYESDVILTNGGLHNVRPVEQNGTVYVPVNFAASVLSLSVENAYRDGSRYFRIKDSLAVLDFEVLIALYEPSVIPDPPRPEKTPDTSKKRMAVSFDGFVGEYTEEIISACAENGIEAAFFFTADELSANAGLVRRLFAEGHQIGVFAEAWEESGAGEIEEEVLRAKKLLRRILKRDTRLVRFSADLPDSLRSGGEITAFLKKYSLIEVPADVYCRDWLYTPSEMFDRLISDAEGFDRAVMRFTAGQSVPEVLEKLARYIVDRDDTALIAINEASAAS